MEGYTFFKTSNIYLTLNCDKVEYNRIHYEIAITVCVRDNSISPKLSCTKHN